MSAPEPTGVAVHHIAICPADMDASLRFYCDGIGLRTLFDTVVEPDLVTLLNAPTNRTRTVFLGVAGEPNTGCVELMQIDGFDAEREPEGVRRLQRGMCVLSFQVDVEETLRRLKSLGLASDVRTIKTSRTNAPVACVLDPDGIQVELLGEPLDLRVFDDRSVVPS
ncbi:VOC family protein [Mycobacterium sp. E802]|uniref:VOC family protein n=1 Tax=Mycobacterium sp. E802 TaxID=1834152 RepID=UPI000A9DA0F5|nr:VOC family protein [Mycobacterium sp. E802]